MLAKYTSLENSNAGNGKEGIQFEVQSMECIWCQMDGGYNTQVWKLPHAVA